MEYVREVETVSGLKYFITAAGLKKIRELGEQRMPTMQIALTIGAAPSTVGKKLTEMGLRKRIPRSGWSDERVAALKKHWSAGLSASQIANRISGVSRNAVIGKLHRLGLSRGGVPKFARTPRLERRERSCRPSTRWGKVKSIEPIAPTPLPPEQPAPDKLFKLVDMEPDQCRFVYGDPKLAGSGFCGCPVAPGASYCPGHLALCTDAVQPKKLYASRYVNPLPSGRSMHSAFGLKALLAAEEFLR